MNLILFVMVLMYLSVTAVTYGIVRQTIAVGRLHMPMSAVWPATLLFLVVVAVIARLVHFGDRIGGRLITLITG